MLEFLVIDRINEDIKSIRNEVFVDEQGFKEEFDSIDNDCMFCLVKLDKMAIATARFFLEEGVYHIGRFAVLKQYRNQGIGNRLLSKCEDEIKKRGGEEVALSAQLGASGFYKKNGYNEKSSIYYEQNSPHIKMTKRI